MAKARKNGLAAPEVDSESPSSATQSQAVLPPSVTPPPVAPSLVPAAPPATPPLPPVAEEKTVAENLAPFVGIVTPPLPKDYGTYSKENDAVGYMRRKLGDSLTIPTRGKIVSTGIMGLDILLGGGLNYGSIHEAFGMSKSGKSYLMQKVGAMTQAADEDTLAFFFDRENAYDLAGLQAQGCDPSRTIIVPPAEIPLPEDLWTKIVELMGLIAAGAPKDEISEAAKTSDPTISKESKKAAKARFGNSRKVTKATPHIYMAIDSIPAFAEQQDMIVDQGRRAKSWHAFLRRMTGILDSKLMMMVSNHIIYKPGVYGNPESKTSGLAIDYYRDCGVKCQGLHEIYDGNDVVVGNMLGIEVDKSRRGGAGGHTYFPVRFKGGANYFSGVLPVAEYFGLVKQTNASAFKDRKAYGRVWPRFEFTSPAGKRYVLSEDNPEELAKGLQESGLYAAMMDFAKANLAYSAG